MLSMNGRIPFDAALAGDKVAKEVVENYYTYLAEAVANYVNIFRPDVVILAGGEFVSNIIFILKIQIKSSFCYPCMIYNI